MHVTKDAVVTLRYELFGSDGELIEKTRDPISYLHGGYQGIFSKVEQALDGQQAGYACRVALEPDDAFGEYEAELVKMESRELFPKDLKVGMQFEGGTENAEKFRVYTVTDIAEDKVVVDGNHPLAGRRLVFACTIAEVRAATADEIAHRHVHGAHGHHH